ncbi:MAG: hypothetical protein WCE80_08355 [Acidimicrobiia bacterium]
MNLSEQLAEWESFYVAAAGAAAVLLGLVFVALSLHFERHRGRLRVRGLAIQSAASLFYALLVSLLMLVPEGRPTSQGVTLLVVSLFGIWTSAVAFGEAHRSKTALVSLVFRFALPLTMMLVLLVAAVLLLAGVRLGVWLVAAVVFFHILLGTQNAWDLFLGAGSSDAVDGPAA